MAHITPPGLGSVYRDRTVANEGRIRPRQKNVARLDRRSAAVFHVDDDVGCLEGFADSYFDWVYLDTSHEYARTTRELAVLKRKVRRGGLMAGDDWQPDLNHAHHGLCRAGRELCDAWGWELVHSDSYG